MGAVERLDTFGAWLLERLVRGFSSRGAATEIVGLKQDYRALMDELHQVKLEAPARRQGGQITAALGAVGRNVVGVGDSFIGHPQHARRARASRSAASSRIRAASASPRWCTSSTTSPGAACRSSC